MLHGRNVLYLESTVFVLGDHVVSEHPCCHAPIHLLEEVPCKASVPASQFVWRQSKSLTNRNGDLTTDLKVIVPSESSEDLEEFSVVVV